MLLCASILQLRTSKAEVPHFPLRADWVGNEVLAAPAIGGPDAVPRQLFGQYRVSLCVKPGMHRGHAWIRYENLRTGEVSTIGRYQRNVRPTRRKDTREVLYPKTTESGLHWNYEWRYEHKVRQGEYVIDTVVLRDPVIFGHDELSGHRTVRHNCITYARDAWQFYSGQRFDLALIHTPENFLREINREGVSPTHAADEPTTALRRLPPVR